MWPLGLLFLFCECGEGHQVSVLYCPFLLSAHLICNTLDLEYHQITILWGPSMEHFRKNLHDLRMTLSKSQGHCNQRSRSLGFKQETSIAEFTCFSSYDSFCFDCCKTFLLSWIGHIEPQWLIWIPHRKINYSIKNRTFQLKYHFPIMLLFLKPWRFDQTK
jgi:hypothetical protein